MTGLSWLLLALGASAHATEFQLDTDTPDALCPELSMTREAVRQRLGQLETEAGARWHGSYSTVHDPSGRRGDYVRLVIRDAEGKEHLDRELPLKGESCDTLAQAIALVVDGFFRELAQSLASEGTRTQEEPAGSAPQHPTPTAPPLSSRGTKQAQPPPVIHSRTPHGNHSHPAGLSFGAGYESVPSSPGLDFGGFLAPAQHWRLQLRLALPLLRLQETHEGQTATAYLVPTRLAFSYVLEPVRHVQWLLGPQALMNVEHAASRDVPNGNSGWRASFGFGAQTSVAFWLSASVALAGTVSADQILYQSRKFLMYGHPVLESARTRMSGTFGVWMVIWP